MMHVTVNDKKTTEEFRHIHEPLQVIAGARATIRAYNAKHNGWIIVLDDDPTGCQTVNDVPIITSWETDLLAATIASHKFFFILTNSRAYPAAEAARINKEIVERVNRIAGKNSFKIISRSDSTLRGHFLEETTSLLETAGPFDGLIIVPYFGDGNRFTKDDIHYIVHNSDWIEVHQTEFASDAIFGYTQSWLPGWIEERSKGRWLKENVTSVSLDTIRNGGVEAVYNTLMICSDETPIVVNALTDEDIEVVVLAICKAEEDGKKFLYRSAASFVKIRAGINDALPFTPSFKLNTGIIIVGSYVQKTTEQLNLLLDEPDIEKIEISVKAIFSQERNSYLTTIIHQLENLVKEEKSVILYTQRDYAVGGHADILEAGRCISDFLSEIINKMTCRPDYIIAKGGITSHDIATNGLSMKKANVLGQIAPGVPVWQAGDDSKFPGLLYVVFPGNVGSALTLKEVFSKFSVKEGSINQCSST